MIASSGVNTAAERELERKLIHFKGNGEGLFSDDEVVNADTLTSNVAFARQLQLINEVNARKFLLRIQAAEESRKKLERTETRDIVNDYENPLERERRFLSLDETAREAKNIRNTRVNQSNESGSSFRQGDGSRVRSNSNE